MLGIQLQIDKGSVSKASKEIQDAAKKVIAKEQYNKQVKQEVSRQKKASGIKEEKGGKSTGTMAAIGGAIGGALGSLISQLKPIKDLLGIISGIMQIILMPVFMLLKPFLILFLKVGLGLYKWLNDNGMFEDLGALADGISEGGLREGANQMGESMQENGTSGIWAKIGTILLAGVAVVAAFILGIPGLILVAVVALITLLYLAWDYIKAAFIWIGDKLKIAWEWVADAGAKVWDWIVSGFEAVLEFGIKIWEFFVQGLELLKDFGTKIWTIFTNGLASLSSLGKKIWDFIKEGLSSISNLGSKIWSYIKSALSSLVGKSSKSSSVDDALITSDGAITRLNPNDNVIAFQDFSALGNYAGGGSSKTTNLNISIQGFVGDEQTLAEKMAELLNKYARGSSVGY